MNRAPEACQLPWPELPDAMEHLARASGLAEPRSRNGDAGSRAPPADASARERWIESVARSMGMEAVPVVVRYAELGELLWAGAPLLFAADEANGGFLAVCGMSLGRIELLRNDGRIRHATLNEVRSLICHDLEAEKAGEVDLLLGATGVSGRRRLTARAILLEQVLEGRRIGRCWMLRPGPSAGLRRQFRRARVGSLLSILLGLLVLQSALLLTAWWLLGRSALAGRLDRGWLWGWVLLLATAIPFQVLGSAAIGELSLRIGVIIKQQLLNGALQLDPDAIRHQGVGQLLGKVLESEAVESLGLSSSLLLLLAVVDLVTAAIVLGAGTGGSLQVALLGGWVALSVVLGIHYVARWRSWTETRFATTHLLVERMIGNRTRIAQESPAGWHEEEDGNLARYIERSRALDTVGAALTAGLPRGWFLVGILGLAPALVRGDSSAGVAVAVGGVLLASLALRKLAAGILAFAGARVALDEIWPLFKSARLVEPAVVGFAAHVADGAPTDGQASPLLRADRLRFRHSSRSEPVLRGASLSIKPRDLLLLQGSSGAGKSTLASILGGLRAPDGGLLTLHGIDRQTLGSHEWRHRIVIAPQFHENHLFGATLAFNLLAGSRWPASGADFKKAEDTCRALGLGDLLDKMPAGIQQMVGETGWQLSHGERSRVYIARALLQGAEVCILDESFAALDAFTLRRALDAVVSRTNSLIVIQ